MFVYIYLCICVYVYIYLCMYVYMCVINIYTLMYSHVHMYIYIHVYIYIHIYIYVYTSFIYVYTSAYALIIVNIFFTTHVCAIYTCIRIQSCNTATEVPCIRLFTNKYVSFDYMQVYYEAFSNNANLLHITYRYYMTAKPHRMP